MNTLWVFGDSYFEEMHSSGWPTYVKDKLSIPNIKNLSHGGTGPDYTYCKFYENRTQIKPGDVIICGISDLNRKWFFYDKPHTSSMYWNPKNMSEYLTREQVNAVTTYVKYLSDFDHVNISNLYFFLKTLDSLKDNKVIVMSCFLSTCITWKPWLKEFTNIHVANGSLLEDISNVEFSNTLDKNIKLKLTQFDFRKNHMTLRNHHVLADKISDYIKNNVEVNFKEGFHKNFITEGDIYDKEFLNKECFGNVYWLKEYENSLGVWR